MKELLIVGISEYKLAKNPKVIATYALGSCVGVCLYDRESKIGGLSHVMLPESIFFAHNEINRMKFADTALVDLVDELIRAGAQKRRLIAKIAGGAKMFEVQPGSPMGTIGERNISSVKAVLHQLRIPILAEDVGANYGRTLYFDLESGVMKVQALSRDIREY